MSYPNNNTDYYFLMKSLLLEQFKKSENINKILNIQASEFNRADSLAFSALESYFWDNIEGNQLDTIGEIVGFERQGRSDTNYKSLLQLKIRINISAGEIPILLQAIEQIFEATTIEYVQDFEHAPATVEIYTDGKINLVDEFYLTTESGDRLLLERRSDQMLTTEAGDTIVTEDYENIEVNAYEVATGDNLIVTQADDIDESILYEVLPSGVGLRFLSMLQIESGDFLTTEAGERLLA